LISAGVAIGVGVVALVVFMSPPESLRFDPAAQEPNADVRGEVLPGVNDGATLTLGRSSASNSTSFQHDVCPQQPDDSDVCDHRMRVFQK
jgi:hypothetical protein